MKRKEEPERGSPRYTETHTPIWDYEFQNFVQRLSLATVMRSSPSLSDYLLLELVSNVERLRSSSLLLRSRSFLLIKEFLPLSETHPKTK